MVTNVGVYLVHEDGLTIGNKAGKIEKFHHLLMELSSQQQLPLLLLLPQ